MVLERDDQELWDEFHRLVNMSSRELAEWLQTWSAGPEDESYSPADAPVGHQVWRILGKRQTDLNDEDVRVMREVVGLIRSERRDDLEPAAGTSDWRHRLMSVGHDPLKPVPS